MRGDSLRDLYAKALALLGLGLLGLAGALVDYWPIRGELPRVASALDLPDSLSIPSLPTLPPVPQMASREISAPSARAMRAAEALAAGDATLDAAALNADLAEVLDEPPPPALAPPPPPSLAVVPARPDSIPSSTLDLQPPVIVAPEEFLSVPPAEPPSSDNMFEGAAKTVGRVGLKTGTVIASGFRAVGHVFRW